MRKLKHRKFQSLPKATQLSLTELGFELQNLWWVSTTIQAASHNEAWKIFTSGSPRASPGHTAGPNLTHSSNFLALRGGWLGMGAGALVALMVGDGQGNFSWEQGSHNLLIQSAFLGKGGSDSLRSRGH